ncbi:10118_t:CDS:1 [Paraglomus occultum]|uniref:10118_t:CDS:1 n=1 Tax=Paraglomus occultum TaxID=144539 RepID=A0A9N9BB33_9GLOM|nr:10118_t:CDS:1 [Paraglomus occultum]
MNLPIEILSDIFKCLLYDFYDLSSLHSCVLVNRTWCQEAVRWLYKNPFGYYACDCDAQLLTLYISYLPKETQKLFEFTHLEFDNPANLLFNYPAYIEHIDDSLIFHKLDSFIQAYNGQATIYQKAFDAILRMLLTRASKLTYCRITTGISTKCFSTFKEQLHHVQILHLFLVSDTKSDRKSLEQLTDIISSPKGLIEFELISHYPTLSNRILYALESQCDSLRVLLLRSIIFSAFPLLDWISKFHLLNEVYFDFCEDMGDDVITYLEKKSVSVSKADSQEMTNNI